MVIFNNTSADFVLIPADVLLKMIIILIELKIVQLCSYNVTEFNYNIYSKRSKSVLYQKMPKYVLESQKLTSLTGLTFSEALIAGVQNPPSEGYFFSNFSCMFLNLDIFFSNLICNCSNLLDLRNLQEQVKKTFCNQKLF